MAPHIPAQFLYVLHRSLNFNENYVNLGSNRIFVNGYILLRLNVHTAQCGSCGHLPDHIKCIVCHINSLA